MKEQTASKVPKIRFKGFEAEWKEEQLGRIADVYQPRTIAQRELTTAGFDVYGANGIIGKYSKYNHKQPQIAVTCRGNTCGTVNFTKEKSWITGNAMVVNVDESELVNKPFLFQQLSKTKLDYLITGSGQPQITGTIKLHKLWICDPAEQSKIGGYFRELDRLIGLHQRKYDKLVTLKKAMLQKMFPQPGATIPEVRFKGFLGDWVENTLGQLIDLGSGRDYKHLSPGNIPVYGTGGYMLSVDRALSNSDDAVGIGRKGTIDKPFILKAPFWTVDTLFYAIPKGEACLDFVYCAFQRIDWRQKDESTGVPSLSKVAINGAPVLSTSPLEQQKVGTYFRTLDVLICKHATQLRKLQQIKTACLEKMFV